MTSRTTEHDAATNIDFLLMFVAAIRAVVPDLLEVALTKLDLPVNPATRKVKSTMWINEEGMGLASQSLEFKSGMDVWTWATNKYEPLAIFIRSLSEEQRVTAQRLLKGMLQEVRLASLADYAGQLGSAR